MEWLKMLSPGTAQKLVLKWQENEPLKGTERERDFFPECKLFNPGGAGTWLLSELDPNSSLAFGLCDLGMGEPELGYVDLEELYGVKLPGGLKIEQDRYWRAGKTLGAYAEEARRLGYIKA